MPGLELKQPKVPLPRLLIDQVREFSEQVLSETYDRFHQNKRTRLERIFVGKLGEVAFSLYLEQNHIEHDTSTMFEIFPGVENADSFDFCVPGTSEAIDVKTAYRDFHSRILIPSGPNGQWTQMPKDYYVGLRLKNIVGPNNVIDLSGQLNPYAIVYGFIPRNSNRWNGPTDFGEGPCMWVSLSMLTPIVELLRIIHSAEKRD